MIKTHKHDDKTIGYDVQRDQCSFSNFFDTTDWKEFMAYVRQDGWRMQASAPNPDTGKPSWSHFCPTCTGRPQASENGPQGPPLPANIPPRQIPLKLPKGAPQAVYDDESTLPF